MAAASPVSDVSSPSVLSAPSPPAGHRRLEDVADNSSAVSPGEKAPPVYYRCCKNQCSQIFRDRAELSIHMAAVHDNDAKQKIGGGGGGGGQEIICIEDSDSSDGEYETPKLVSAAKPEHGRAEDLGAVPEAAPALRALVDVMQAECQEAGCRLAPIGADALATVAVEELIDVHGDVQLARLDSAMRKLAATGQDTQRRKQLRSALASKARELLAHGLDRAELGDDWQSALSDYASLSKLLRHE